MRISETKLMDFSTEKDRWEAVVERNSAADGQFVYGVMTTGIYCRPGCPSRRPKRENVRFFDSPHQAEQAGLRPCKRCEPNQPAKPDPALEAVVRACKLIDDSEESLSLRQLADSVGLSPWYFQRQFKKIVGITPKQYATEKKRTNLRANLPNEATVTEAVYNAGYETGSRFYETATESLGMQPKKYQRGGQGVSIRYAVAQSVLGWVLVASTDKGICRIEFGDAPEMLQHRLAATFPQAKLHANDPAFESVVSQVLAFLKVPQQGLTLPLDIQGTAFQQRVWAALQTIPAGSTAGYAEIAAQIGQPKAARAVAQACASNHLAVAVPCHRVVRSDGGLGGYRWGLERKRALLRRESDEAA